MLYERKIDFIINIPSTSTIEKYVGMLEDEYQIRRKSLELGIPVLWTTIELNNSADSFVKTLNGYKDNETTKDPIQPYDVSYLKLIITLSIIDSFPIINHLM